jgi:glycosyltransferase involved in cell wall biosynthesis
MDDASLRAALADADLALLPSWSESFGLAIAEAQAAALPVVAYAAGSVPEVVEDGVTAWLAPVRDVAALAERLHAACADPEGAHRMGLAGRARVLARFRWEETAERLLDELLRAPTPALRAAG